jgi:beta-aspartyl-dipeptidase (metallo-type)
MEAVHNSEIPIAQFLPTHVNRTPALLQQGVAYVKEGGYIDLTAHSASDGTGTASAISSLLDSGCPPPALTISSDGNGSMPKFNDLGELIGMERGSVSELYDTFTDLVHAGMDITVALQFFTTTPAARLKLEDRKGRVNAGFDADLVLLDRNLNIEKVFSWGRLLLNREIMESR